MLPTACVESTLSLVHDLLYLSLTKKDISSGKLSLSTGDTYVSRGESWLVDRTATGASTLAVNYLFSAKLKHMVCIVRSPGHHATPNKGMGFCLFSHIAIAPRYAQKI